MESWKTAKAVSLRETAIEKMREKDFAGGRKSAAEAQKLCPTLEDIDRVILVCNVHCAAADDKDWYKILDVAPAADESAVRSRCSRMALGLHPDKNKFPGAAEAFQLFVEAKNVLLNNEKRRVYDSMCRAKAMGENWSSGFSGFRNDQTSNSLQGFARFRDGFKPQQEIDQAIGNLDSVFSRIVNDQQCQQLFHQLNGENGRGLDQSSGRGRGRGKPRGRGSKTNEGVKIKENVVDLAQNDHPTSKDLPNVSRGRGRPRGRGSKMNEVEGLMMSSSSKENVVDMDQNDQPNLSRGRGRGRPRGRGRGRGRESKLNEASKIEGLMSTSSSSKENVLNLDEKGKVLGDDGEEETADHKAKKSKNNAAAEEADKNGKRGVEFEHATMIEPDSKILEYTDAEFNDFEKERCITSFGEGQVWAVYDTLDAMPRFYAMINSITHDHKMQITWLEPLPNNDDEKQWLYQGLPACSGRFKHGHTDTIQDHAVFSHLVTWKRDAVLKKVYEIHPKKGETWAVFKNWDISKPQRCGAFEYEVVEILSDYYSEFGVSVALLGKIEGFCCVFGRKVGKGVDWEVIKGKDRLRFSHRIPSVSVTINNPNGVGNFFELDPASLPPNLDGR